ncbi:hypothetical protein E8E14_000582 [Neopestalotiopsis sp. 37M]|nr:hypothetical protein E8E14_000582 [Neopestalotiopsis sp. 37M]
MSAPTAGDAYTCSVNVNHGTAPAKGAKAHHVYDESGRLVRFKNPCPSFGNWHDVPLWKSAVLYFGNKLRGKLPVPDTSIANIPTVKAQFLPSRTAGTGTLRATWIGHATYFVEFPSGFRALFDPVFEERHNFLSPKRFTAPACAPSAFPDLDAVFFSHNHPDHLSYPTVKELIRAYPNLHFFVGLGESSKLRELGVQAVTEMDWWDDAEVTLSRKPAAATANSDGNEEAPEERIIARISCLPSQHGTMRTPSDMYRTLWASWSVTSGDKSVWFAGDTGYRTVPDDMEEFGPGFDDLPVNPHFAQIGELRGPFDLGLLPIGAYHPRMMYSPVHSSPYDAVEIFQDTRCKKALAMHWGTWALTSEPVNEPPEKLKEALKIKGIAQDGVFDVCAIGESREF